jgi:EAL domain-containing protein (putative c-di-GMP-specific phosphodiesterase class I)
LRQHFSAGQLERDCRELLGPLGLEAGQVELRIAERTLAGISRPERVLRGLADCGAALVIDEVGRGFSSLQRLAQLQISALQIDRALAIAAAAGGHAERACRATAALAQALGVMAVAPGTDSPELRARLLGLGFIQGLGDVFPALPILESEPVLHRAAG